MITLGIVLVIVGASLLVAEAHVVSYGALGVSGLIALAAGGAIAVDGAGGGLGLVLAVSATLTLFAGAMLAYLARAALTVSRTRPRSGREALIGHRGVMRPGARVLVDGALWRAWPTLDDGDELVEGEQVVVEQVRGLTLGVRRAEEWELEP